MTAETGKKVAGVVVVVGLALALAMPLVYGVYDLVKLGGNLPAPTASKWMEQFLMLHPIVGVCAGFAIGVLAGHFGWYQVVHDSSVNKE